jgi:CRP-like cAMP-binding protein
MDASSLNQLLSGLRFSASLPDDLLAELAPSAVVCDYSPGEILFREGSSNPWLMIIARGRVTLAMHVPGRVESPILSLGPGDMLAWSALLGAGRMTTSATAAEDTQIAAIPSDTVLAACDQNPQFGYRFMRQLALSLAERLVATRLQLLDLFGEPAVPPEADS